MKTQTSSKHISLPEVHRTVDIPASSGKKFKRLLAFLGPAYLVSVGYMDPGNWATDIEGGARFGYTLIWVLLMSNLIAILLQTLSARLGIATGRDLAQACRDNYPKPIAYSLWILCEVAIAACDLAEVLGTAIGLNLLFGIPVLWGVLITAVDTIFLLAIQNIGVRKFEAFILSLVFTIGLCFIVELFLAKPVVSNVMTGFIPHLPDGALYVAIGIIGATVMPHNLYLHSALVQTRAFNPSPEGKKSAAKYNLIDSVVALNAAFFVNAAILIIAAAVFYKNGVVVTELQQAHALLTPLLGTSLAGGAFAIALLAAGQSSTLTGTLAGQIVMEGFIRFKMRPFLRRFITRMLAIVPAVIVLTRAGEHGTYDLLILSQVVLSLQLPFAIIPLIHFTSDSKLMGKDLANKLWVKILAWISAAIIVGLNIKLVLDKTTEWMLTSGNPILIGVLVIPCAVVITGLLLYVTVQPLFRKRRERHAPSWQSIVDRVTPAHGSQDIFYKTIAVAIAHEEGDAEVLRHAVAMVRRHNAHLVLVHVVEGAVGDVYGHETYDAETRDDEDYMIHLNDALSEQGISVTTALGYGDAPKEIIRLVTESNADVLIMGSHGHRGIKDIFFGTTISPVRHGLTIPVLIIR